MAASDNQSQNLCKFSCVLTAKDCLDSGIIVARAGLKTIHSSTSLAECNVGVFAEWKFHHPAAKQSRLDVRSQIQQIFGVARWSLCGQSESARGVQVPINLHSVQKVKTLVQSAGHKLHSHGKVSWNYLSSSLESESGRSYTRDIHINVPKKDPARVGPWPVSGFPSEHHHLHLADAEYWKERPVRDLTSCPSLVIPDGHTYKQQCSKWEPLCSPHPATKMLHILRLCGMWSSQIASSRELWGA